MARGTGITTKQILEAPHGAVFVWCNSHKDYAERLARKHGRDDLKIVSPSWLTSGAWQGTTLSGIVVDHAAELSDREYDVLQVALTRVRPVNSLIRR